MKNFFLIFVLIASAAICKAKPLEDSETPADTTVLVSTTEAYVDEETLKIKYRENAKEAGLKEKQLEPTAHLLWMIYALNKPGIQKSILANHCEMLNDDGVMLEVNEKHMPNQKWSQLTDANTTEKIEFWWEVAKGDCKVAAIKAFKNICVLFLNPEERKKIEGWAREAGILEEEIQTAVDMEMRIQMSKSIRERDDITLRNLEKFGKNQYVLEPTLTQTEMEKLKSLKTKDYIENAVFWAQKYNDSTGADHIKALKNLFVTVWAFRHNGTSENNA